MAGFKVLCARRSGEEVTISYGDWPNDVFLLFFGFLPEGNQHDSVVLFHGLQDLIQCYGSVVQQQQQQQQKGHQQQHTQQQRQQLPYCAKPELQDPCSQQQDDQELPLQQQRESDQHHSHSLELEPPIDTLPTDQQPGGQPARQASDQHQQPAISLQDTSDSGHSHSSQPSSSQVDLEHAAEHPLAVESAEAVGAGGCEAELQQSAAAGVQEDGMPEFHSSSHGQESGNDWAQSQLADLEARLGPGDWSR